ncbi:SDR family NAD(P)-dependent oxidoreductase [Chungangia koreensis]|uniref:SDR family NAD(P)-dependent oxidoreductase n=1 Tax=Chungangia koreensis TaxID=752657 RepID=A0ABV8X447_9LACT
MEAYIVTGASKGIGKELVEQLTAENHFVIGLSRSGIMKDGVHSIQCDLSDPSQINAAAEEIFNLLPDASSYTLINNAGMIEPIGLAGEVEHTEITKSVAVNLTATMILSNYFIHHLKDVNAKKQIINISSGAGRKPYEGWSSYCTTKAGVDHFSRVVALEQKTAKFPVQIVSIAPGIIDTGMQEKIRSSKEEDFPLLDRFKSYKENEQLSSPSETATELISFMKKMHQFDETILDLRNL